MMDDINSDLNIDSQSNDDSDSQFDLFEVDGYMVDFQHDEINDDKNSKKGKTFLDLFDQNSN